MSRRTERIASQLLAEVAHLLREVTDPRVGLVTLTRIDVAPDLSNAVVFWSALDVESDEDRLLELQAGLDSASPFLRRRAAKVLPMKRMPELRFRYDPSLVLGTRTLSVLRDVTPAEPSDPSQTDDATGGVEDGSGESSESGKGSEHGA